MYISRNDAINKYSIRSPNTSFTEFPKLTLVCLKQRMLLIIHKGVLLKTESAMSASHDLPQVYCDLTKSFIISSHIAFLPLHRINTVPTNMTKQYMSDMLKTRAY